MSECLTVINVEIKLAKGSVFVQNAELPFNKKKRLLRLPEVLKKKRKIPFYPKERFALVCHTIENQKEVYNGIMSALKADKL